MLVDLPAEERVKLLSREYPHFIENPLLLKESIDGLRRLRGNEKVDEWNTQIDQERWHDFLKSILIDHYDLVYRRPGSGDSIYHPPELTLAIPSADFESYFSAAKDLTGRYQ